MKTVARNYNIVLMERGIDDGKKVKKKEEKTRFPLHPTHRTLVHHIRSLTA
jgi:hypothetical protein